MQLDVTRNTRRNIVFGIINKIVLMVLPLISRSVINITIGAEYLGLNSLFTSIITVLSLTELGFSEALVYNMYKPIADNDQSKINAILNLYKTVYRVIGLCIFGIGLSLIPFLPKLIHGHIPDDVNLFAIYIIQLINTSISYFLFGYKQSLLVAYQREDVNSLINLIVQICLQGIQILVLLLSKNYYFYIILLPIFTIINNLCIGIMTNRMFPDAKCEGKLDGTTLSSIKKLVAGTFIQRACAITRNSLDSICISSFLGLAMTGIYNNYYYISVGLTSFLGIASTSLSGGIGNHVATRSVEENYDEFKKINFLYMIVSGAVTVFFICLVQPFMEMWMGKDMMVTMPIVVLFGIYFYLLKVGDMMSIYCNANGIWWENRYRALTETVANCVLNIVLGKFFGMSGIILATIISLFVCNVCWSTTILFENYFKRKGMLAHYFSSQAIYGVVTVAVCFIAYILSRKLIIGNPMTEFLIRGIVCALCCLLYLVIWHKTKIFKNSIKMLSLNKLIHRG